MTPRKHYTIRQLADEFGITARTIRFYEQKGILASYRVGSARSYSPRDRSRLAAIVKLRELGFSVTERGEILGDATSGASELKLSLEQVNAQMSMLQNERRRIDKALAELEVYRDTLTGGRAAKTQL